MNRIYILSFVVLATAFVLYSCKSKQQPAAKPESTFIQNGSVKEINIMSDEPDFPEGKGRSAFISNCSQCHSLRYILMQPDFPRKIWQAEVDKMLHKYNAQIDSTVAVKIVDYLVTIKGVKS